MLELLQSCIVRLYGRRSVCVGLNNNFAETEFNPSRLGFCVQFLASADPFAGIPNPTHLTIFPTNTLLTFDGAAVRPPLLLPPRNSKNTRDAPPLSIHGRPLHGPCPPPRAMCDKCGRRIRERVHIIRGRMPRWKV
jgi:hypothetical protein